MSYNNSVLIGDWSERRLQNEHEFMVFLRKRDRKELLLQKSRTLFSNLLMEKPLAISGSHVMFGYNVQLVTTDMPGFITMFTLTIRASIRIQLMYITQKRVIGTWTQWDQASAKPQGGLALSILVTDRQVDYIQNIADGCLMTLSPITTPCCRNTFVILSAADENSTEKMNYGDEFLLKAENYGEPDAPPLYVRYSAAEVPSPKDRMPITLSSTKDSNCRWSTMPLRARDRLEGLLGAPVKTAERLIIKNCVADMSLCVMNHCWIQTFFGPECGVMCGEMKDRHKRYTAECIFSLISDVETTSHD